MADYYGSLDPVEFLHTCSTVMTDPRFEDDVLKEILRRSCFLLAQELVIFACGFRNKILERNPETFFFLIS